MDQGNLDDVLDRLCQRGCREVNLLIRDLESGKPIPDLGHLDQDQIEVLLEELRGLMAIYAYRCGV